MLLRSLVYRTIVWVLCGLSVACCCLAEDFTLLHVSDQHSGAGGGTAATVKDMIGQQRILLEPYGVTSEKPAFVVDTGDFTEFGPIDGAYDNLLKMYAEGSLFRYPTLGNHDNTWRALSPEVTKGFGAPYYSFDRFKCHFVVLNSAGFQDPSPTIGPEQIDWLRSDLRKTGKETPVFVALHHPLGGSEFAGAYQMYQLLDVLRPYNVVLIMVGHGHRALYTKYEGYDMVEGGSGYGPGAPGYNVISVTGNRLRVAYKETAKPAATIPLLDKEISWKKHSYPDITITSPVEKKDYSGNIDLKAGIGSSFEDITKCEVEIDSGIRTTLESVSNGRFRGNLDISNLLPGAHFARFIFTGKSGQEYHRSIAFYVAKDSVKVIWRRDLKSAVRSTPLAYRGAIYAATYDGRMVAVKAGNEKVLWTKKTGYAISGDAVAREDRIFFGCSDGNLYCLDSQTGKEIWKFAADSPIFSSPVTDTENIYFGTSTGAFYSISMETGRLRWRNTHAAYNIESKPYISNGRIYYGAWDCYVYCVSAVSGALIWKCMGQGSSEGQAPRYYSPADCGPVVCGDNLFIADRKYRLSIIDISTGKLIKSMNGVSAVALSADSKYVYLRNNNGQLSKVDESGDVVWNVNAVCDSAPVPPKEQIGMVYVCSKKGIFCSYSSDDGTKVQEYKLTPGLFTLAGISAMDDAVFLCGTDGVLTAIDSRLIAK